MMQTHPSALLLAAQLLHVMAWPFLEPSVVGRAAIGVIGMVAVASAVYAVRRTPGVSRAVLFLGAPAVVFTLLEAVQPDSELDRARPRACCTRPSTSTSPTRCSATSSMTTRSPATSTSPPPPPSPSWRGPSPTASPPSRSCGPTRSRARPGREQSWFELLYLSFSTLTSVGLSDIVAVGLQARSLVMLEMMAGVFYIALVVSRMVGLTMMRHR